MIIFFSLSPSSIIQKHEEANKENLLLLNNVALDVSKHSTTMKYSNSPSVFYAVKNRSISLDMDYDSTLFWDIANEAVNTMVPPDNPPYAGSSKLIKKIYEHIIFEFFYIDRTPEKKCFY